MPTIKLSRLFITMAITLKTDTETNSQFPFSSQGVMWGVCMYVIYTVLSAKLVTVQEMKLRVTTAVALLKTLLIPEAWKGNLFRRTKNLRGCYKNTATIIRNNLLGVH